MHLFFKISSGLLTSLHQPNYPQPTSNSLGLSKTSNPHKSPWPTLQPFLSYPHDTLVPQEAVTEDWPSALILNQKGWNDRAHMGSHWEDGSLCWPCRQRMKSQWSMRLTELPKWHAFPSLAPIFSRMWHHQIPDLWLSDHPFREYFISGI